MGQTNGIVDDVNPFPALDLPSRSWRYPRLIWIWLYLAGLGASPG